MWLLKNWKLVTVVASTATLSAYIGVLKYENKNLSLEATKLQLEVMEQANRLKTVDEIIAQYQKESEERKQQAEKAINEARLKSLENYKLIEKLKHIKPSSNDCESANSLLNDYFKKDL